VIEPIEIKFRKCLHFNLVCDIISLTLQIDDMMRGKTSQIF